MTFACPILTTERLRLRQLHLSDAPQMQQLLEDAPEIADNVLHVKRPYPAGQAEQSIQNSLKYMQESKAAYYFCVVDKDSDLMMGRIWMHLDTAHNRSTCGYWLGKPYWGKGYMSEAVRRAVQFGFEDLDLHRISSSIFPENGGSIGVVLNAGMTYEGTLRQHIFNAGKYHDLAYYGILRSEWENAIA